MVRLILLINEILGYIHTVVCFSLASPTTPLPDPQADALLLFLFKIPYGFLLRFLVKDKFNVFP